MKRLLLLIFGAILMSSCAGTQFYQVYDAQSDMVKFSDNSSVMTYEDSNCRINYNLWSENGNAGFTFYNKSDEVIHLLLDQSFYVLNGMAYDYYQDRIFSNGNEAVTRSSSSNVARLGLLTMYNSINTALSTSSSTSVNEAKVISIPPKTSKRIFEFDINQVVYRDCELIRFPSSKTDAVKTFSQSASPLTFYNNIVFTKGEAASKMTVRNDFYISQITNLGEKKMFKTVRDEFCNQKGGDLIQVSTVQAPNRFFVKYRKGKDVRKY